MLFRSDRKSTRLNSSHTIISYAVFCLKKKNQQGTVVEPAPHATHPPSSHLTARAHHPTVTDFVCAEEFEVWRVAILVAFFFFNDTATTEIYTLSLHDALPILRDRHRIRPEQPDDFTVRNLAD